jgi:hypothetical protein
MGDFGVVEALHDWSRLKQDSSGKLFFVPPYRKFGRTFQPIMATSGVILWNASKLECRFLFWQIPHAIRWASLNTTAFIPRVGQILKSPK